MRAHTRTRYSKTLLKAQDSFWPSGSDGLIGIRRAGRRVVAGCAPTHRAIFFGCGSSRFVLLDSKPRTSGARDAFSGADAGTPGWRKQPGIHLCRLSDSTHMRSRFPRCNRACDATPDRKNSLLLWLLAVDEEVQ